MKPLDINYLSLQFKIKIHSKNGTEFQTFFENIMEIAFPDFKKVPSGGGDGGNDGWIKNLGRYYQVYAPNTPAIKDSDAATKLVKDFNTLKKEWGNISEVKEFYFVYNDKYSGSQKPEKAVAELEKENPNVNFVIFLAKDLEILFFSLSESDILSLGFNIDSRQSIVIANEYLQKVEVELDKDSVHSAYKILKDSKDIISNLSDEGLSLEFDILECRCLQRIERIDEAKERYEIISKRFPDDPRSFLYLAEIYLYNEDFTKNAELIAHATKIDGDHWQLKIEELVRKKHLGEKIDLTNIDESTFPESPRLRVSYYRLYAEFLNDSGDKIRTESFIEKAIHLNPDRFSIYIVKLAAMESQIILNRSDPQIIQKSQEFLDEIKKVENKFCELGNISARNMAILNFKKLNAFNVQERYLDFIKVSEETFKLAITCYFDKLIDQILSDLLRIVSLPQDDFVLLIEYLRKSKKDISDGLSKSLIFQFNIRGSLFVEGKRYFMESHKQAYVDFIDNIENANYDKILSFLKDDIPFATTIADAFKNLPDLRRKIIEFLPDDSNIQKDKLLLLLNFEDDKIDDAFNILKEIDLSSLSYLECKPILRLVQNKKAWDFEIIILEKLLEKEQDDKIIIDLNLQAINAYFNLNKYVKVIDIGEKLLNQDSVSNILDIKNRETLLTQTIIACFERGKVDNNALVKALEILNKYKFAETSFEFKAGIEAEVYLNNNEPHKALAAIVEGVKIKKVLTPEEYAKLYFLMTIKLDSKIKLKLETLNKVKENTFIKMVNKDRWYYIGSDNELDAINISKQNDIYPLIINQSPGSKIVYTDSYGSGSREDTIETIFSIEQYIMWQVIHNFEYLSKENILEGVQVIKVANKEGAFDLKYLLKFFDDLHQRTRPFFDTYCKNGIPLAMLAVFEGGILNAIGRIQQENKGFVNCSTGSTEELEYQRGVAKNVIDNEAPFYMDFTSALVLSEKGLLKKVYPHLPNLRVPQSVITALIDFADKFKYSPKPSVRMGYSQGKLTFSPHDEGTRILLQSNLLESVKLLESKPECIIVISSANKADCASEQKIPAELCDACILAQKDSLSILTEDYLYLKMNELETKKKPPEYFSSIVLLKVLYDKGLTSFDEYLDYFAYLSSYRFRFLSFNDEDIEKAVFGDGPINVVNLVNIRKLNFQLTLSEEYGVPFQTAFTVVVRFLFKALDDDSISPEIIERIFIEIVDSFPTKLDKKFFGQWLLDLCIRAADKVNKDKSELIIKPKSKTLQKKIDKLLQATEIYKSEILLWTPK